MRTHIFHDLDTAQNRLVHLAEDIGYLILAEVTSRHNTEKLARIDFTVGDLTPFLRGPAPATDEFPEAGQLEEADDGFGGLRGAASDPTPADLANAAFRWVQDQAGANMSGARRCKFKLSVWGPKGDKLLYSTRFSCENPDCEDEEEAEDGGERKPPPMMPAPAPDYATRAPVRRLAPVEGVPVVRDRVADMMLMLDAIPEGRVWMALGAAHANFVQMLQDGYDNLTKHQHTILNTQNTQILRNQKVLEDLAGQVIQMRTGVAASDREEREEVESARTRQELGKEFIGQLGSVGRVIAVSKFGVPPELAQFADLAEVINASPELSAAIKSPQVLRMLKEESTRKDLANLLMNAAAVPDGPAADPTPANDPPKDEPKAA